MRRYLVLGTALLAIAACGPAAEESDDPGATPTPTPTNVSTATAPPPPADVAQSPPPAFGQCTTCHRVEPGGRGIGPSLAGVFGAEAAHVGDYAYSAAMRQSGLTWDEPTLHAYLEAPMKVVPGTKMAFAGVKDPAKRQAIIDYLKTL